MEAYRLAAEAGADAIELDVHLTADGELAVIHDESLDRTTDMRGEIARLRMDEIRAADAGATFAGPDDSFPFRDRGLTVPTLAEVLAWLPKGISLVVEVKARAAVEPTVRALQSSSVYADGSASVISFDEQAIEQSRQLDPALPTGLLLVPSDSFERGLVWATEHGHAGIHPYEADLGMDPTQNIMQATAYGRQVGCYVVNDPNRMLQLALAGLWGFVTDVPDVARAALTT